MDENINQTSSGNSSLLIELAECYASVENFDKALDCYRRAALVDSTNHDIHVAMGLIYMQAEDYKQAINSFKQAVWINDSCVEAYSGMAMAHQKLQEYPAAFDMYLKCLELDSDNLISLLGLFQTSCQMGTFAKVIQYLEIFLESHPRDVSVLFCLATLYARDAKFAQARDVLIKILVLEPQKTEAVDMLAQINQAIDRMHQRQPA